MNSNMAEVSAQPDETARKGEGATFQPVSVVEKGRRFYSLILNRFAPKGTGEAVSTKLGISESTVSRAKADAEAVCGVIAALDLKVVAAHKVCVDPGEINFLRSLYDRVKSQTPWLLDAGDE